MSEWRGEPVGAGTEWTRHRLDSKITQIKVDYGTWLLFQSGVELIVESPYQLEVASENWTLPDGDLSQVAPVLQLLHRQATDLRFTKKGRLELGGDPSFRLTVLPDDRYESWQLLQPDGSSYVCLNEGWVKFAPGESQ